MVKRRRCRAAVLLGGLLLITLVGLAGATASESPAAAASTWTLTVPAAAFHPEDNGYNFYNSGWMLRSEDAVQRYFTAYVPLPYGSEITLDHVEVLGKDNTTSYELCVEVLRFDPDTPGRHSLGKVCSGGSTASPTDPNTWTVPLTSPATIG